MIDYLEAVFVPAPTDEVEGRGVPSAEEAQMEKRPLPRLSPEEPEESSTNPGTDVEIPRSMRAFLPGEHPESMKISAVEEHSNAFVGSPPWMDLRRPLPQREGEGLERRLRRDSRRYDSGFYRY